MATYATYRHIELDKVGYGKKRVRSPSSDIFNVLCSPSSGKNKSPTNNNNNINNNNNHVNGNRKSHVHNDSFNRLFGADHGGNITPRRASLNKQDITARNPVTGDGVTSWDQKKTPSKIRTERNPVTGEYYTIVSPATTPTKQNGFSYHVIDATPEKLILNGNA